MKPSEFLRKINVDVIGDLSELDKRFFDREEIEPLKDKIEHLDKEGYCRLHPKDVKNIHKVIDETLKTNLKHF